MGGGGGGGQGGPRGPGGEGGGGGGGEEARTGGRPGAKENREREGCIRREMKEREMVVLIKEREAES